MFKSLREFTFDNPVNRKKLKIRFMREGRESYTLVQLYDTIVVKRQNINNVVTLNSGGFRTQSTKVTINTALKLIYGQNAPYLFQRKFEWFLYLSSGQTVPYADNMVIGGGCGAKYSVLNAQ